MRRPCGHWYCQTMALTMGMLVLNMIAEAATLLFVVCSKFCWICRHDNKSFTARFLMTRWRFLSPAWSHLQWCRGKCSRRYEEGDTPASTVKTYIEQFGRYRKVGDVVYIMSSLRITICRLASKPELVDCRLLRLSRINHTRQSRMTSTCLLFDAKNLLALIFSTGRTAAAALSTEPCKLPRVQASGWYHTSD